MWTCHVQAGLGPIPVHQGASCAQMRSYPMAWHQGHPCRVGDSWPRDMGLGEKSSVGSGCRGPGPRTQLIVAGQGLGLRLEEGTGLVPDGGEGAGRTPTCERGSTGSFAAGLTLSRGRGVRGPTCPSKTIQLPLQDLPSSPTPLPASFPAGLAQVWSCLAARWSPGS